MAELTLKAHFDGHHIRLDEPFELKPHTRLLVTVLDDADDMRQDWINFGLQNLERAYSDDEPEYRRDMIREANPDYEGR